MLKKIGRTVINTDHIVRIDQIDADSSGTPRVKIVLSNGDSVIEWGYNLDYFEAYGSAVIPAPEGFSVIYASSPDDTGADWQYWLEPIIAFAIPEDRSDPIPVLIDGWKTDGGLWAIRHPDGRCEVSYDRLYESEAEWKQHLADDWAASKKRGDP